MSKYRGIIAETGRATIKAIFGGFSVRAYADETPAAGGTPAGDKGGEGDNNNPSNTGESTLNYEDLIAKARKEEKDKQYKTIEGLRGQANTLTTQHNNDLLRIAELEKQLNEANAKLSSAGSGDTEAVKTLKAEIEGLQKDKTALEAKVKEFEGKTVPSREDIEAEVRKQLEAEYEVKTYKAEQIAAHKDELLVPELVFGDTKEAIDTSLKAALARSAEIRKNLGIPEGGGENGGKKQTQTRRQPKTPNPSTTMMQTGGVSIDTIAQMDVKSPEYAALRKQLGLA